mgnify:CR=1 FL=1
MTYVDTLGQQAKVASRQIAKLSTAAKNDLLNQRKWYFKDYARPLALNGRPYRRDC